MSTSTSAGASPFTGAGAGTSSGTSTGGTGSARSLGQLVSDLSEQGARLVRAEIDLAKAELVEKTKSIGLGAGLLIGAGVVALYLVNAVLALVIIVLATFLPLWLSALIVVVVLTVVAAVLALLGKKRLDAGTPPKPTRATENVQEDVTAVKEAIG